MAFPSTFLDLQTLVIKKSRVHPTNDLQLVKDSINLAHYDVCVETEALPVTATMTLTAGSASYTLPGSVARVKQMSLKPAGSSQFNPPLIRTTLDEILQRRQGGGDAQQSGCQVSHFALIGINDLELWPTPPAADVIYLTYFAFPAVLVNNTDVPVIEEPYATNLLSSGALVHVGDFKGDPSTEQWKSDFDTWMQRYLAHLDQKQGDLPGQFHQWGGTWDPVGGGAQSDGW